MEKKQLLALLGYLVIVALYIFIVISYVDKKDYTLREQAYTTFNDFFKHQKKYIDTYDSRGQIKYNLIPNPPLKKPGFTFIEDETQNWRMKVSDIYKFYKISDIFTGWKLFVAEQVYGDVGTMVIYKIFPTHVAYRKQNYSFSDIWYPSIEDCVEGAYEFYTTDPKSNFIDEYKKGNAELVYDFISKVRNEYYSFYGEDMWQPIVDKNEIGTAGYMYNDFYRTFIGRSDYTTYKIEKNEEVVTRDKAVGIIIGFLVLSVLYASLAIYWTIQNARKKELLAGPLYNNLKSKCNPANFMDPYDQMKIDVSNRIYRDLLRTAYSDINALKVIRKRMAEELDVKFIDREYIEALKAKCCPAQFMDPYDAEKVSIANMIYSKLMNSLEDIEALEEIEKEIEAQLS